MCAAPGHIFDKSLLLLSFVYFMIACFMVSCKALVEQVLALVEAGRAKFAEQTLDGYLKYLPDNKKLNAVRNNTVAPVGGPLQWRIFLCQNLHFGMHNCFHLGPSRRYPGVSGGKQSHSCCADC